MVTMRSSGKTSLEDFKNEKDTIRAEFDAVWPKLLDSLMTDPAFKQIMESMEWFKEVMVKNVPFGKKSRAMIALHMYRHLAPNRTPKDDFNFYIIGWCIEILQAAALMSDDMMDCSETRRGVQCWYRREDVGMSAINDVLLLENMVSYILIKFMGDTEDYVRLSTFVHHIIVKTILGQTLDMRYFIPDGFDIRKCTMEKYATIVQFKTSYYTFFGPIGLSMIMAGVKDRAHYDAIEGITMKMGHLFQIQDDFLDCYGNPAVTGKIGTDIIDGKCTWLICKAAEIANDSQRKMLQESYGSKLVSDELAVTDIYKQLRIPQIYLKVEKELRNEIVCLIKELPPAIPKEPLFAVVGALYRRRK